MIALLLAASGLVACDRTEKPPPQTAPVAQAPPAAAPVPLPAPTALTREDLLRNLAGAASAYAAGEAGASADLVGRTFRIVLPFGCAGPAQATSDGLGAWSRSADGATIKLSIKPADWSESTLVTDGGKDPAWDAVSGFWIARPWLLKPGCPAAPATAVSETTTAPTAMTTGLAWILRQDGSRLGQRRGEAYSFTLRDGVKDNPAAGAGGYRLVLEGRIGQFADGAPIRCTAEAADRAPACVAAVQVDVLAFEDLNGTRLREWRPT